MKIGYARVSTAKQAAQGLSLEAQEAKLREDGCERVFVERGVSGTTTSRPELDRMMDALRPGDTVVVWKLDRLGRDHIHLQETVESLSARGIGVQSLTEPIFSGDKGVTRLMVAILSTLASIEREKISERTKMGLEEARRQGKQVGGRRAVTAEDPRVQLAAKLHSQGWNAAQIGQEIARVHGGRVPARQTVYRYLDIAGQAA